MPEGGAGAGGASGSGGAPSSGAGGTVDSGGAAGAGGASDEGPAAGAGGESGAGTVSDYFEETDAPEPVDNDDRDHVLPMPHRGSLWLPANDRDWFYVEAPDDGRAHVLELRVEQDAPTRAEVVAYAAADNSEIGRILVPQGTTRTIWVSVGPGTTAHIEFRANRPGRLDFVFVGMTAELDEYEPNNDRDSAKPVAVNTPFSGQQIIPYSSDVERDLSDWYEVTLDAGEAVVNVLDVPDNVGFAIRMLDEMNNVTNLPMFMPGVIGSREVTIPTPGKYRFQLTNHSNSAIPAFASGTMPANMSETYTVRIDQPPAP